MWPFLGFLTTWKDVHRPAGSSPQLADAQRNYTLAQEISQPHTLKTNLHIVHLSSCALYVAVGVEKQCELTCRPAGYRFYVRQAERVRDGTPCINVSSNDVCVEGQCLVSAFHCACV